MTFDDSDEEDINYVESQNKTKTTNKIAGIADPILFLGPFYHENPEHFEINRGERKQLQHLVALIKNIKTNKVQDFFIMEKFKIDHSHVIHNTTVNGWYFGKQQHSMPGQNENRSNDDLLKDLRLSLKREIMKFDVSEDVIVGLLTDLKVDVGGKSPIGIIKCGWCTEIGKLKPVRVSTKSKRTGGFYWVTSNFATHYRKRYHLDKGILTSKKSSEHNESNGRHSEMIIDDNSNTGNEYN